MDKDLTHKAITAALQGDWPTAVELNIQLLKTNPDDIATLNRLGKAYSETNERDLAKQTYKRVIELDKYNPIAIKNLKILSHHNQSSCGKPQNINLNFIEEPGKTKTIPLTRLGEPKILCRLIPGQVVNMVIKNHTISITTDGQEHVGTLTDDIAYTLKSHIKLGNKYMATIKSASPQQVTIFIREVYRDTNLNNSPTFTHTLL